jgi:hypothetical protein
MNKSHKPSQMPGFYKGKHSDVSVISGKETVHPHIRKREVAKKIDMMPWMKKHASKEFNPFDLVTHINGRRIHNRRGKKNGISFREMAKKMKVHYIHKGEKKDEGYGTGNQF